MSVTLDVRIYYDNNNNNNNNIDNNNNNNNNSYILVKHYNNININHYRYIVNLDYNVAYMITIRMTNNLLRQISFNNIIWICSAITCSSIRTYATP